MRAFANTITQNTVRLSSGVLKKALRFNEEVINPYGDGKTSEKMLKIIKKTFYGKEIDLKKEFYDL